MKKKHSLIRKLLQVQREDQWRAAIQAELTSLEENQTWTLQKKPAGKKTIGSKWVFRKKPLPDGSFKYKARLVATGYSQIEGVDYTETFAPVLKYQSLRMLMAVATEEDMHVHQMDVTTAFLYGDLEEEVYLQQPEGAAIPGQEHMVCKLKKSLYGLKQSPRCWNTRLDGHLKQLGFKALKTDSALYTRGVKHEKIMLAVYVDDLLISSKSSEICACSESSSVSRVQDDRSRGGGYHPWNQNPKEQGRWHPDDEPTSLTQTPS